MAKTRTGKLPSGANYSVTRDTKAVDKYGPRKKSSEAKVTAPGRQLSRKKDTFGFKHDIANREGMTPGGRPYKAIRETVKAPKEVAAMPGAKAKTTRKSAVVGNKPPAARVLRKETAVKDRGKYAVRKETHAYQGGFGKTTSKTSQPLSNKKMPNFESPTRIAKGPTRAEKK